MKDTCTHAEVDQILATLQAAFTSSAVQHKAEAEEQSKRNDLHKAGQSYAKALQALEDATAICNTRLVLREKAT